MSSIKFSQLQSLTSPPGDTVFPVVSSGSNYKLALSSIKTAVIPSWSEVTGKPNFNSVAFSGLYADLSGKPTIPVIPTLVSAFTNDRGYLTTVDYGIITNAPQLSAVATSGNWLDIVNKPAWFNTTTPGYLYSDGSGTLSFQNVIDTSGGVSTATVKALIANSLSNFVSGVTTATVTALIANSLSNFVTTATVTGLIANSLTNYATQSYVTTRGYLTTASVATLIANSLTNNLATVARTGNWTDVVNKPEWFMTTATGYLYSDGSGTLSFQTVQGGGTSNGWQLTSSTAVVSLASNGTTTFPNGLQVTSEPMNSAVIVTSGSTHALSLRSGVRGDQANAYVNLAPNGVVIDFDGDNPGPWVFRPDGSLQFPDGSKQITANSLIQSATAPATTSTSTLWYDTVGGRSYVYFDNSWVDASPVSTASATTSSLINGSYHFTLGVDGTINFDPATNGKGVLQTTADLWFNANGAIYNFGATGDLTLAGGNVFFSDAPDSTLMYNSGISVSSATAYGISTGGVNGSNNLYWFEKPGNAATGLWNAVRLNSAEDAASTGSIVVSTGQFVSRKNWIYAQDGTLTLPGNLIADGVSLVGAPYTITITDSGGVWPPAVGVYTRLNGITPPKWTPANYNPGSDSYITYDGGWKLKNPAFGATPVYLNTGTLFSPSAIWNPNTPAGLGGDSHPAGAYTYKNWTFGTDGSFTAPGPIYGGNNTIGLATPAPLNLNNTGPVGQVKTQLNLINTAGNAGTGSAIDYFTYVDQGNGLPGARLQAVDDNAYSANFSIALKGKGNAGNNGLTTVWTFGSDGTLKVPGTIYAQASDNGSIVFSDDGSTDHGSLKVDNGHNMVINAESNYYVKRNGQDRFAITDTDTTLMAGRNLVLKSNKNSTEQVWSFNSTGSLTFPDTTVQTTAFTGTVAYSNITGAPASVNKTSGSWILATGANTVSITVAPGGNYQMWVNGNVSNGIVEWNATVNVSNPNVPAIGSQYAWYYAAGNALVLTAIPNQIVGTAGVISSSTSYVGTTSNVFSFGITNNSASTQTVYWGYTTL